MKSINIVPRDREEFDMAFSLLTKFCEERILLSLEEDEDIIFAFLIRHKEESAQVPVKVIEKKSGNEK
jgi:hypothetical protein